MTTMNKQIVHGVIAAAMAAILLAGCSSTNAPAPPAFAPTPAEPQTLALNLGNEPPTLDSVRTTGGGSFSVLQQIAEGLVRLGPNGEVAKGSGAAADWSVSGDGLTYTFTLKPDLHWSDGQPLTAKDFAYAWLRALDPNTGSRYNYMLFAIKGAKAFASLPVKSMDNTQHDALKKAVGIATEGDKTLVVTLEKPAAYFPALTAFPTLLPQRQDIVEKYGDKYAAEPNEMVYNGPFVIKSWTHQSQLVLEKNASYWDAAHVRLSTVTMSMVADTSTALNLFEAGQLDSTSLPGTALPQYQGKPGYQQSARPLTWYLEFNTAAKGKPYLANPHIHTALSLAIDRQTFVNAVLKDGSVAANGLVPATMHLGSAPYRQQAGAMLATTVDKAKAAVELAQGLKDVGLDKLPPIELAIYANDTFKKSAQGLQAMIQDALPGVTVNILPQDPKVLSQRIQQGDFELTLTGWQADYDDPLSFLDLFTSDSPQNDSKWHTAQYDSLIHDAQASVDQTKRLQDFQQAEKLLMADLPVIPVWYPAANSVDKPYVKGLVRPTLGAAWDLKYTYIEGRGK